MSEPMTSAEQIAERIAAALERIAERLDPNPVLVARVATLEALLKDVMTIIEDPQSTDETWTELLEALREALP